MTNRIDATHVALIRESSEGCQPELDAPHQNAGHFVTSVKVAKD
jgi:hypothetical protein